MRHTACGTNLGKLPRAQPPAKKRRESEERNDKPSSLLCLTSQSASHARRAAPRGGAGGRRVSSHSAGRRKSAKAARAHSLCCSPKEQGLPIRGMDRVATRSTSRSHRAAAPSALGMNEPLNAPLGSVEDELRFALGGDVDVQLFDGDIDEALRSAAGGDDDGSVADPFASRPGSPLDPHGAGGPRVVASGVPAPGSVPVGRKIRTRRARRGGVRRAVSWPVPPRLDARGRRVRRTDLRAPQRRPPRPGGDNMDP
ncbi:hypothetical protein THAOC_05609, partial [Thalassiosira oceanica]